MHQWEKTKKSIVEQRWKTPSRTRWWLFYIGEKIAKLGIFKHLLTVLNCQVIKAKSKWSKLSFFCEKLKNTKSRKIKKKNIKVPRPGDLCSKSRKKRKFKKSRSRKAEHFFFREKFHLKGRKVRKSRPFWLFGFLRKKSPEKSKKNESRKLFDFLTFCEQSCNFRAVRLPARGALSNFLQYLTC